MSSQRTLSKGVTDGQFSAFENACRNAGLSINDGKEAAFKLFCEKYGVNWPAGFSLGGDRKSMKTYTINLSKVSWHRDNIEVPGNGRIAMAKYSRGDFEMDLDDGNKLSISLIEPDGGDLTVKEALIVTTNNEIVRYLKPNQIRFSGDKAERKCPKCKDGLISDDRGDTYDCDRCNGTGVISLEA